jgi:hypothetical protein
MIEIRIKNKKDLYDFCINAFDDDQHKADDFLFMFGSISPLPSTVESCSNAIKVIGSEAQLTDKNSMFGSSAAGVNNLRRASLLCDDVLLPFHDSWGISMHGIEKITAKHKRVVRTDLDAASHSLAVGLTFAEYCMKCDIVSPCEPWSLCEELASRSMMLSMGEAIPKTHRNNFLELLSDLITYSFLKFIQRTKTDIILLPGTQRVERALIKSHRKDSSTEIGITKHDLIASVIRNLPAPVEEAIEWNKIVSFREDEDSKLKFRRMYRWLSSNTNFESRQQLTDHLSSLLSDYEKAMRRHDIFARAEIAKSFISPKALGVSAGIGAGTAQFVVSPIWAAIAGGIALAGGITAELAVASRNIQENKSTEISKLSKEVEYLISITRSASTRSEK